MKEVPSVVLQTDRSQPAQRGKRKDGATSELSVPSGRSEEQLSCADAVDLVHFLLTTLPQVSCTCKGSVVNISMCCLHIAGTHTTVLLLPGVVSYRRHHYVHMYM